MADRIEELREKIAALQGQLEDELEQGRDRLRHRIENGRVIWEEGVRKRHLRLRQHIPSFVISAPIRHTLTAPVIYSLIVPFALLHLWVWIYQAICFPVYGIPKVPRREYIRIDRHQLAYLNGIQKLNCIYCGYCNGVVAWVREVAGRTEAFWCPIKHAMKTRGNHEHYALFSEFGDGEHFREEWEESRRRLAHLDCKALGCARCGGEKG